MPPPPFCCCPSLCATERCDSKVQRPGNTRRLWIPGYYHGWMSGRDRMQRSWYLRRERFHVRLQRWLDRRRLLLTCLSVWLELVQLPEVCVNPKTPCPDPVDLAAMGNVKLSSVCVLFLCSRSTARRKELYTLTSFYSLALPSFYTCLPFW